MASSVENVKLITTYLDSSEIPMDDEHRSSTEYRLIEPALNSLVLLMCIETIEGELIDPMLFILPSIRELCEGYDEAYGLIVLRF